MGEYEPPCSTVVFYNHAATPGGAICLLLRPCRQCTHMHAISRVQMQVYWTLEPKSFCHYYPKKPPYLHFIWSQIIIPNLLPWTLFMRPIFFLWMSSGSCENISILLDCQLNSSSWQCLNCPIIGAVKTRVGLSQILHVVQVNCCLKKNIYSMGKSVAIRSNKMYWRGRGGGNKPISAHTI